MKNSSENTSEKKILAKKSLGQHFLKNPRILRKIISIINPKKDDSFIEIGCGSGQLTQFLAESGAKIVAIETDRRLYEISEDKFKSFPNCTIVKADIMKTNFSELVRNYFPENKENIRVAGNIPYNISSQILFMLLDNRQLITDITFLIQKEMAERLTAKAGEDQYGYPSVVFGMFFESSKRYNVSGKSFTPPARVESTVISLKTLKKPLVSTKDEENFLNFIKICFSHRRKTIRNNIKEIIDKNRLKQLDNNFILPCGLSLSSRAEEFDIFQFRKLYDMISPNKDVKNIFKKK